MSHSPDRAREPFDLHADQPHSARVWNYWLGGKDNFAADRAVGERVRKLYPGVVDIARHTRRFLGRAVHLMAGEYGIRQFLDIGAGLPAADNTHEVAQRVDPRARIVYVDNDPLVLVHARALLTSSPEGECAYVDADVHHPEVILEKAVETLNFNEPIGLVMLGILGNVPDDGDADRIRDCLIEAIPSGSFLALEDGTNVIQAEAAEAAIEARTEDGDPYKLRSPEQITRYFEGLDLLDPGVVSVSRWRSDPELPPEVDALCGLARKP